MLGFCFIALVIIILSHLNHVIFKTDINSLILTTGEYRDQNWALNLIFDKRWLLIIILNQLRVHVDGKNAGQPCL